MASRSPVPALCSLIGLLTVVAVTGRAQSASGDHGLRLLPRPSLAIPLVAAPREARTGLRKEIGSSRMRLEIGTIVDLLGLAPSQDWDLRFGADIFAYGLTTSSSGLRLQVDAIDGFFGGHISAHYLKGPITGMARLRLLHHSAHFVDGHYDLDLDQWKGGVSPTPYTRDAGELLLSLGHAIDRVTTELYAGAEYATFMRPDAQSRWNFLGGLQARVILAEDLLGESFSGYLAYHIGIDGVPDYEATQTVQAGVKFGAWEDRGVRLYGDYTSGLEPFGQYYTVHRNHWGVGFALDIW